MPAPHAACPDRRTFLTSLGAAAIGAPAILRRRHGVPGLQGTYSERALRLVHEHAVVDLLNQFRFADYSEQPPRIRRWLTEPGSFTADDFARYRASGISCFCLGDGASDYEDGLRFFAEWNGFIAQYPDWLMRVDDAGDFARAHDAQKVGIMLTFQTSDHLRSPDDVNTFWGLGQRLGQLTYNFENRIGAGFLENDDGGLTVFGHRIVQRMNEVGMAVDVSHCGDHTTMDALAASAKPVLFTHAGCRAVAPGLPRLKTDEAIRAMARTGGMMGIPLIRFMIREREPVTIEHVLDHYDHVARLVGVEHVGVGGDLDLVGNPNPVGRPNATEEIMSQPNIARYHVHEDADGRITIRGLDHVRRMYDLTEGLIRRRYSDADIGLMLGGNAMRVFTSIWPA